MNVPQRPQFQPSVPPFLSLELGAAKSDVAGGSLLRDLAAAEVPVEEIEDTTLPPTLEDKAGAAAEARTVCRRARCWGRSIPQASQARYCVGLMQVQIEQVHWSGLKGSERSIGGGSAVLVVLSERLEGRDEETGLRGGIVVEALRLGGRV